MGWLRWSESFYFLFYLCVWGWFPFYLCCGIRRLSDVFPACFRRSLFNKAAGEKVVMCFMPFWWL